MTYGKKTQYTCLYEGMRGVDFSPEGTERRRFSYLENMWRDYDADSTAQGCIESIPGFRRLFTLPGKIHGIYRQPTPSGVYVVVHAGNYFYRFPLDERDSIGTPTRLASVRDADSRAIAVGSRLYVLDGEYLRVILENGTMGQVDDTGISPYCPRLYDNGVPVEQRNLLTDRFEETYTVGAVEPMAYGSPGLRYEESAEDVGTATVVGIGTATDTELYIPARITIGGRELRVTGIADRAFANCTALSSVHVAHGVETVGARAFEGCSLLRTVVLHDSVLSVGARAFASCGLLKEVYIGYGFLSSGEEVFDGADSLTKIYYADAPDAYYKITGREALPSTCSVTCNVRRRDIRLCLPVFSPAVRLTDLYLDGESLSLVTQKEGERVVGLYTDLPDRTALYGKTFLIKGRLSRELCTDGGGMFSFLHAYPSYTGTTPSVIHGCTVCSAFDGRLFLSGHPALPGLVFYSQRNRLGVNDPTYFGVLNYFVDGIGTSPVVGLLPCADALAVFKREDDGAGGIFYHKGQDTEHTLVPRIYPVAYVHNGLGAYGACLPFLDDAVFVGTGGIQALEHENLSLERSIATRSHAVSARLLGEDLSAVQLCRWLGYLVVSVGGRMYLADSRSTYRHSTGSVEYEWFYLDGIGTYEDDEPVYRYASVAPSGVLVSPLAGERVPQDTPVVTAESSTLGTAYVTGADGQPYAVHVTEQRQGGAFFPASSVASFDDLLLFGTESGTLCVFNTDKRGTPPQRIAEAEDFDADAYRAVYGRRIHPDFYSFAGHAPRYALLTVSDNVGLPHLQKRTVPHSLVLKCRSGAVRRLHVQVGTDRSGFETVASLPSAAVCFEDMDFSSLTWEQEDCVSIPLVEKKKGWIEKQIAIYCDEFCSPIGVSTIAYRYTVEGTIRR